MRYRLNEVAYINDRLWQPGEEIGDGTMCPLPPDFPCGPHMDGIDGEARRRRADYDEARPGATLDPWQRHDVPIWAESGEPAQEAEFVPPVDEDNPAPRRRGPGRPRIHPHEGTIA